MKPWSREETIIAFNLYCKIPFNKSSKNHPLIIQYAKILGRTPSALNMKIGNIGRLDPDLALQGITGLAHGAKLEQEVWDEFNANPNLLAFESERLIAKLKGETIDHIANTTDEKFPQGEERLSLVKQRVNQSFFRSTVLNSYEYTCCISGVSNPSLVEACHIVDWANDIHNRTNPHNGLCLNPFLHKAYDKHLIAITPDFEVVVSDQLLDSVKSTHYINYLQLIQHSKIKLPNRFLPHKDFLAIHYENYLSFVY